jgi:hypothetical protein
LEALALATSVVVELKEWTVPRGGLICGALAERGEF